MYKTIRHTEDESSRLYWSSDWHFHHDPAWDVPIWRARGHRSAAHSAEEILKSINDVVPQDGILYYLGDGFLNCDEAAVLQMFSRINCRDIRYIFGNHESAVYRLYRSSVAECYGDDEIEVYPHRIGNVTFYGNCVELRIGKRRRIVCSHFPHRIWNHMSRNSWMLSGHSHGSDPGRRVECKVDKALDVGWDVHRRPISYTEIKSIMTTKDCKFYDHHAENR